MSNDRGVSGSPLGTPVAADSAVRPETKHVVDSIEGKAAVRKLNEEACVQNSAKKPNGIAEDDSEAETEIESGKEDGKSTGRRSIKHEGRNDAKSDATGKNNGDIANGDTQQDGSDNEHPVLSAKDVAASNSSILTPVVSSPSRADEQSSRAGSENAHSPSKTSIDSDTLTKNSAKRKRDGDEVESADNRRRIKREHSPSQTAERAGPNHKTSKHGSNSPPGRQRRRTMSTASASLPAQQQRGRRRPSPIQTGQGRSEAEPDDESDQTESSSEQPRLPRKSTTGSHPNTSGIARKMAPAVNTTRYRDRSGRTLLAKACHNDSLDAVRERLEENPEHLDEKENAENSPLQIAALRGDPKIVKFLIDQGADIHTMNADKDTPLIDAVENGNLQVVRILLDAGVNPTQPNAKGEEPLELIPEDEDDEVAIRAALLEAKEKRRLRRPSEPAAGNQPQPVRARQSAPANSPRDSPSLHPTARHGHESSSSRRAQRGASTRNDLLWIAPTPARLQKAAGEGDVEATSHILGMGVKADSEAILAAAKGCHEDCLGLLIALGNPEVDPDPISGLKPGWDTPLLAAIGQGVNNIGVLKILLEQPGFNPTRRLFHNKRYHEIALERAGPNAEVEYNLLKQAYENYVRKHGSPSSGRVSSSTKKQKRTQPSSPQSLKQPESEARMDSEAKMKRLVENKPQRKGSVERPSSSHSLPVPPKLKSRDYSIAVSDREVSPPTLDKRRRTTDASEEDSKALPKQRKRLLTGKERREGEELKRRRSSITSVDSTVIAVAAAVKRGDSDLAKKSIRASTSPVRERGRPLDSQRSDVSNQKLKRQQSATSSKLNSASTSNGYPDHQISHSSKQTSKHRSSGTGIQPSARRERSVGIHSATQPGAPVALMSSNLGGKVDVEPPDDNKENEERRRQQREQAEQERQERQAAEQRAEAQRQEQERKQKEEEEKARKAKAEHDRIEAERKAIEDKRKHDQERLPDGFFHALYSHTQPPSLDDLKNWRILKFITTERLRDHCPGARLFPDGAKWILNFQAAILLGIKDWTLPGGQPFDEWPRIFVPPKLVGVVRNWWRTAYCAREQLAPRLDDWAYMPVMKANTEKFIRLGRDGEFFWIPLEGFMDVLPKYSHLQGLEILQQPVAFRFPMQPVQEPVVEAAVVAEGQAQNTETAA